MWPFSAAEMASHEPSRIGKKCQSALRSGTSVSCHTIGYRARIRDRLVRLSTSTDAESDAGGGAAGCRGLVVKRAASRQEMMRPTSNRKLSTTRSFQIPRADLPSSVRSAGTSSVEYVFLMSLAEPPV